MTIVMVGGCSTTGDRSAEYVGPSEPVDNPATPPNEAFGPGECDLEYDPHYCGDYHGP
jgi:hypothetical protein